MQVTFELHITINKNEKMKRFNADGGSVKKKQHKYCLRSPRTLMHYTDSFKLLASDEKKNHNKNQPTMILLNPCLVPDRDEPGLSVDDIS